MNYQKHYNLLIDRSIAEHRRRYKRTHEKYIYYERHHIVPKCLGGSNHNNNLVLLTPEEHYVAHQLLVKMHPNSYGVLYAAIRMTQSPINQRMNNKLYSWLRNRFSKNIEILNKEGKIGMKGKKHTVETKNKISNALKGHPGLKGKDNPNFGLKRSEETRRKMSENNYFNNGGKQSSGEDSPNFGLKRSNETCEKISIARTGVSTGPRSEETKQKMRDSRKLQTKTSQKRVVVFGVTYNSLKESCDALNKSHKYIIHRLRSEKFLDCYYL